jgi:excisionase family DNA binding protein
MVKELWTDDSFVAYKLATLPRIQAAVEGRYTLAERDEAPNGPAGERDPREILDIYAKMLELGVKLDAPGGRPQELPLSLFSFLCRLIGDLKAGKPVTILTDEVDLTTVEAAKLLAVSRQFLVQLLEQQEIPFHMVGTHRRVYAQDVMAFKAKRDSAGQRNQPGFAWEAEAGQDGAPQLQDGPAMRTVAWPEIKYDVRDDLLADDGKEPLTGLNALDRLEKDLAEIFPEFPEDPAELIRVGKDEVARRLAQMRAGGVLHAAESDVLNIIYKRVGMAMVVVE